MTQELTTIGGHARIDGEALLVLRFVVKKVKGRSYVYLHGRDKHGKIKTIYIGPLEEIAKYYLINVKGKSDVVDRPGFEPGASRMPTERSSRLSYRPISSCLSTVYNYFLTFRKYSKQSSHMSSPA